MCCCSVTSSGWPQNFEAEDQAASETGLSSEEWTDLQYLPRTGDSAFMGGRAALRQALR